MLAGIGLGTLLAVLAKANGILLPLLALVLEATVLRAGDGASAATAVAPALVAAPAAGAAGAAGGGLPRALPPALHDPIDVRSWTIAERLMTQPRVLLDYLQLLLVPRVLSTGLYNDAYVVSTGWLVPWTTLPAALAIAGLAAFAFAVRRRWPVLSAGLLFWFAGHLLESSVVPLELYFEHRNYLPALLLFWPLAHALVHWRVRWSVRGLAAAAMLALLAVTTWQRAQLWGQPERLAAVWALQNPGSPRSQATAAMDEMRSGRPDLAARRLEPLVAAAPAELQWVLNLADARCMAGGMDTATAGRVTHRDCGTRATASTWRGAGWME
jgi:protein O-mannosyl-transferase